METGEAFYLKGQVADLLDNQADRLVDDGRAEYVREKPDPKPSPNPAPGVGGGGTRPARRKGAKK